MNIIDQTLQNVNIIRSGKLPQGSVPHKPSSIATLIANVVKERYAIEIHKGSRFFLVEIDVNVYVKLRQAALNLGLILDRVLADDTATFNDFLGENDLAATII